MYPNPKPRFSASGDHVPRHLFDHQFDHQTSGRFSASGDLVNMPARLALDVVGESVSVPWINLHGVAEFRRYTHTHTHTHTPHTLSLCLPLSSTHTSGATDR